MEAQERRVTAKDVYCVLQPGLCNLANCCSKANPLPTHAPKVEEGPIKSNGGSSSYYDFLPNEKDLGDVVDRLDMPFSRANLFKACMRLGQKDGTSIDYDLNKMEYFIQRMKRARAKGYRV